MPFHIVLVLVALLNALVGTPLHEARHIQEVVGRAAASATANGVDAYATDTPAGGEHSESAHTTCAWCLTHALEASLAYTPAANQLPPSTTPGTVAPQGADPFTAQQVRWPFAARDPPPAHRA